MPHARIARTLGTLFLLAASLAAQASDSDSSCTAGRARGAWDLPVKEAEGHVRGLLADLAGHRLVLEGRLVPSTEPGTRGGRLVGTLTPLTRSGPAPKPIAEVHGTYLVGPGGLGRFEAAIVGLDPSVGIRPELIGKLGGAFADPMRDGLDPVGRFAGRWTICR